MRLLSIAIVCALLPATGLSAQWITVESGTAVVRGRVLAAANGRPLSRATVTLTSNRSNRSLVADGNGWFEFTGLPAGRYGVRAASAGYLTFNYGQSDPGGVPRVVDIGEGEVRSGIDVALPPGGVFAVTVTDAFGAPMEGVWVQAQQAHRSGGRLELGYTMAGGPQSTDDRGQIRIYDLAPGEYYVSATEGGLHARVSNRDPARNLRRLQTFYPGVVRLAEADPVALGLGEEVSIDIAIVQTPVAEVSGRVIREDGTLLRPYSISMAPRIRGRFAELSASSAMTGDEFRFTGVLPGDYLITFRSDPSDARTNDSGSLEVSVSGSDLTDLVLIAKPASRLTGQMVLDTGDAVLDWRDIAFTPNITVENGWTYNLPRGSDGAFAIGGLTGRGVDWSGKGYGWYLKAVMRGGQDVTDLPIDLSPGTEVSDIRIVVTREHTTVTGNVRGAAGAPDYEPRVVIFPEDRSHWTLTSRYIGTTRADDRGRFSILGLPPGRYLAAAVNSLTGRYDDPALREPGVLERLRLHATPLRLRPGQTAVVTLDLVDRR